MSRKWDNKFERKPDRWVFVPTEETKNRGKKICELIQKKWSPPYFYYHLHIGGHVAALRSHYINKYFVSLDVENFFGSISSSRITRHLVPLFGYKTSRQIALDSTVRHPNEAQRMILPYGFVQSPLLASIVFSQSALGKYIGALAKKITVSIYVDDIHISCNDMLALEEAKSEIERLGAISLFDMNGKKSQGPSEKITAFNINMELGKLEITEDRMAEFVIRLTNNPTPNEREGIIGYIYSVNPDQANEILALGL